MKYRFIVGKISLGQELQANKQSQVSSLQTVLKLIKLTRRRLTRTNDMLSELWDIYYWLHFSYICSKPEWHAFKSRRQSLVIGRCCSISQSTNKIARNKKVVYVISTTCRANTEEISIYVYIIAKSSFIVPQLPQFSS